MDTKNTHYTVLELEENATQEEIKQAYRRMMAKAHPDKISRLDYPAAVAKAFNEFAKSCNNAYDVLGNPSSRAGYDKDLAAARRAESQPAAKAQPQAESARPESPPTQHYTYRAEPDLSALFSLLSVGGGGGYDEPATQSGGTYYRGVGRPRKSDYTRGGNIRYGW